MTPEEEGQLHRLLDAAARTRVVRSPKQLLLTFGVTNLKYHVVTEASYQQLFPGGATESVVREGMVTAQQPAVVTPGYMARLEGFGEEAYEYFEGLAMLYGGDSPGLLYGYSNTPGEMHIVEGAAEAVAERISGQLSRDGGGMNAVILGVDDLWDVSLLKFIFDYTVESLSSNVRELTQSRLLQPDPAVGLPRAAVERIEDCFRIASNGGDLAELKRELDRWDVFDNYQERFWSLFKRRRR